MGCVMLAPMELSDSSLLRQPLKVRIIYHCSAAPSMLGRKLCTKFPRPPATASRMFACMLRPECHPFPTPSSARSAPLRSLPMLTAAPWQLPCRRESSRTHPRIPPIFEDLPGSENWCRPCHFIGFGCGQCKPFAPAIPLMPPRDCTHQPAHPEPPPAAQASRCAVCGFGGATRMSDRNVGFHNLALVLAADQVWSVDPPDEIRLQGLLSVAQNLVSTPWLAYLLRETCYDMSELVIVGWSFGNHFACHASRQLEAAGIRLRGICTLDDRASKPAHDEFDWEFVAQTRPRVRLLAVAMEFISPMKFVRKEFGLDPVRFFGANYEMAAKRALTFATSMKIWFDESAHHSIAAVDVWDIRERLHAHCRPSRRRRRRLPRVAQRRSWPGCLPSRHQRCIDDYFGRAVTVIELECMEAVSGRELGKRLTAG
ncbi:unnamed protein product [Symbiodinium necroappetens]|uniref:Uncharacterized protein n=1 Tax=Symbiodinium necroappetens TaxID=1628268 RepID=A0A812Q370_9DINO|nr:unnamed protein product [Symbiodinium necroappetens]